MSSQDHRDPQPTYAAAKARVEAGDLSFEAIAGMCHAHALKLAADSAHLDARFNPENDVRGL
jgi:hypothetical protein